MREREREWEGRTTKLAHTFFSFNQGFNYWHNGRPSHYPKQGWNLSTRLPVYYSIVHIVWHASLTKTPFFSLVMTELLEIK